MKKVALYGSSAYKRSIKKKGEMIYDKKVRIAVDHGNRNMKTCSQVFTTGLTIQDKKPARGEKFLFYEGKYYVLSENRIPYQRDKTQDDRFLSLLYLQS